MKHFVMAWLLIVITLYLIGCNPSSKYDESLQANTLTSKLYLIREYQKTLPISQITKPTIDTALVNEKLYYQAQIQLNGQALTETFIDLELPYYYWVLDNTDTIFHTNFNHSYASAGNRIAHFCFADKQLDIACDSVQIFINTPLRIDSVFTPHQNRIDIPPSPNSMLFNWRVQGIDSGETIEQYIFLHPIRDSLFVKPLFVVFDSSQASYSIPLATWFGEDYQTDSSYTFYWAISANAVDAPTQKGNYDTSEVYTFRTALPDSIQARLSGSVRYAQGNNHSGIQIQLKGIEGSLYQTECNSAGVFAFSGITSGTYKVIFTSPNFPEYLPESTSVSIPPHSEFRLDTTFILNDPYPPQIMILDTNVIELNSLDYITVFITDLGSGISSKQIQAQINGRTVFMENTQPNQYQINIENMIIGSHSLQVYATDNLGNRAGPYTWDFTIVERP